MHKLIQGFKFARKNRLLNRWDYRSVFSEGTRRESSYLRVVVRPNPYNYPRLGLSFSKRYIKLAKDRNRIKRIVREEFRLNQSLLNNLDIVISVKKDICSLSNAEIRRCLNELWEKIHVKP